MNCIEAYLGRLEAQAPGPASRSSRSVLVGGGVRRHVAWLLLTHLLETLVLFGGWACIGNGALSGRLDFGWLAAWSLALCSLLPLQLLNSWIRGIVILGIGGVLKQRLLLGALALPADTVQRHGTAALLSEVLESEALDELLAGSGVIAALALLELIVAGGLFVFTAGFAQLAVLCAWSALTLGIFARTLFLRLRWSRERIELTRSLIEDMIAHRTRVSQQSAAHWHGPADASLARYVRSSRHLDRYNAVIQSALPRGYVLIATLALTPQFIAGHATLGALATSLGAILFVAAAMQRLCSAFVGSASAWSAWRIVAPLFRAGAREPNVARATAHASARHALCVRDLRYRHAELRDPVLAGVSFSIAPGERILLEGASGSGKSTLAAILAGSRQFDAGYVLAGGFDRQTLGESQWTQQIALAPQYHENHIVSGTLLFNLLLGRPLPHTAEDMEAAWVVCAELGLSELVERMPSGLNQTVGDTGWRLSQGERSRVFLARALLQRASVIVLDESLGALDPENARQCLECLMRRAPALILIAHP